MKKTFNMIKRIFKDNKEYFIKCTIMSFIAALIMGFVIGLTVPAFAADDPTESDQVVIPAGVYTFNNILTRSYIGNAVDTVFFSLPFTATLTEGDVSYLLTFSGVYIGDSESDNTATMAYSAINSSPSFPDATYPSEFPAYSPSFVPIIDSSWTYQGLRVITVTENTSVTSDFGTWFFNNTNGGGSVDPDPEPSYLITSGWYRFVDDPIIDTDLDFDLPFVTYMDMGFGYISYSCSGIITNMGITSIMRYNIGTTTTGIEIDVPVYTIEVPTNPDRWRYPSAKEIYVTRDVTLPPIAYEWFTSNAGRMFNPPPAPDVPDDPDPSPGDGFLATIVKGVTSIFNMQFLVIDGYVITFGGIFSACVGLSLFIWLLKVFAGG